MDNLLGKKRKMNLNDSQTTISSNKETLQEEISLILNQTTMTETDKKIINNIIKSIPKKINPKNKKKINLVLDLDQTLIYSQLIPNLPKNYFIEKELFQKYFHSKEIEIIRLSTNEIYVVQFRKGLKVFFDKTKNFCNYYISTSSFQYYANQIISKMKKKFEIQFSGYIANKDLTKEKKIKNLKELNLLENNTIIFDDNPHYWTNNLSNLILSKYFMDNYINFFLKIHFDFNYYPLLLPKQDPNCKLKTHISIFKDYKMKNFHKLITKLPYYVESPYLNKKKQLDYISDYILKVYYLYYYCNINVPDSMSILKMNIFYNINFSVSSSLPNNIELIEIIKMCGGNIINNCTIEDSISEIIYIDKEKKMINGKETISQDYIYDCYYMNYKFDESDKDYHFNDIIDLTKEDK